MKPPMTGLKGAMNKKFFGKKVSKKKKAKKFDPSDESVKANLTKKSA